MYILCFGYIEIYLIEIRNLAVLILLQCFYERLLAHYGATFFRQQRALYNKRGETFQGAGDKRVSHRQKNSPL